MSFSFDGTGFMMVDSAVISDALPPTAAAITMCAWVKRTATTSVNRTWLSISDQDAGAGEPSPNGHLSSDTGNSVRAWFTTSSNVSGGGTNSVAGALSASAWTLIVARLSIPTDPSYVAYKGGTGFSGAITALGANDWPGAATVNRLRVGARWSTSNIQILQSGDKVAHIAIWNRALTDAEISDAVTGLVAGKNPSTFATPTLYWTGASKTAEIGGIVLVDQVGTITIDGADNPTVDAFGGGANVVPMISNFYARLRRAA